MSSSSVSAATSDSVPESPLVVKMNTELESYFCQAVEHNYERALEALLTNVENPVAVVNKVYIVKSVDYLPMFLACEKGNVSIVEILLQYGGAISLPKFKNKSRCNCLHTACRAGNFQMVKLFCEYASNELPERALKKMINQKSEYAWTPLMFAIQARQVEIVELLLGYPVIILDSLTKNRQNVAHIAAQHSLDCLKAIQSSPHVSSSLFLATDKEGWGVLHRACAGGNVDTLKWIMNLRTTLDGPNGVLAPGDNGYSDTLPFLFESKLNDKTRSGYTPLLVACEYQHKDMVEYLLSLPDVDPSASTSMDGSREGNTGLHIAAIHDSPEIANLLIHHGCPTEATNEKGDTALHIAQRRSSLEVFGILNSTNAGLKDILNSDGQRADQIEPGEVIPPEILKRGRKAVHDFRKALREGKQNIPQCKVLVLGEARVGKTSLVRHLTGRDFIPNLDPTRGIENECITTMVDSANIDMTNWKTISESEQAKRNQEHCISAIAKLIKTEYPALLETETAKENSHSVKVEPQTTEDKLLSLIKDIIKNEQLKHEEPIKYIVEQNDLMANSKKALTFSDSKNSSALPPETPHTQTSSYSEQKKLGINNQRISLPMPKRSNMIKNTIASVAPGPMVSPSVAPNDPQAQLATSGPDAVQNEPQREPINGVVVVPMGGVGRRNVYQKLRTTAQEMQEPTFCLDVLDFAGQKEYRPMHHCFMSRRAIYIVVFNLQHLCDRDEKKKTFSDLKYWLNSVHAHVHNPKKKYEKYIFLVGTHKNPGNGKQITDDYLKKISSDLQEYIFESDCHFKDEIHFFSQTGFIISGLENSMMQSSSGIEAIKKEIEDFSKQLPFLAEVYPISWLNFRDKLLKRKLCRSPLLQLDEAHEIANGCGVEDEAVHTALQLFHDIGVIIYPAVMKSIFLEESEKRQISTVILIEPRWLISIITKVMEVQMSSCTLKNTEIHILKTTGMVKCESLYELWKDDHKGDDNQFQIICLLMQAYGLMQAIKPNIGSNHIQFMIPCMLSQRELPCPNEGYTFYFDFKGFLPQEVFHCLICMVIKKSHEVPSCNPPSFSANKCIWYWFKGYYWSIQLLSQEHRLKVIARPRKEKTPDDLTPIECISFLHEKYIHPICEQSGLPGLTYIAGPMVEACKMKFKCNEPHSAGVLPAVSYNPGSGSCEPEKVAKCCSPTCCEEYNIIEVLLQTYTTGGTPIGDNGSDRRQLRGRDDFTNVSQDQLGEDDLVDVVEEVTDLAAKWRSLGLALRLKASALNTICSKNHNNPTECLNDMLLEWLQQHYDIKKFDPPSWKLLCQAVSKSGGGDNPALARKIADGHLVSSC